MNNQNLVKIWDLPIRIFHWLLVGGFFVAYLTEDELLNVHVWAGYLVLFLIMFRLIWGFVGGQYARFSQFLCTPGQSFAYLKALIHGNAQRYLGHNPAGALMIVFLLIFLIGTALTGIAVYGADQGLGPLASIGPEHEELWEEIHEFFANSTLILVGIHLLGVIVESIIHKESLVKAMLTGYKKSN